MDQKKCSYCAILIPKEAKICPYCRKRLGWTTGAKVGLGVIILLVFTTWIGSFNSSNKIPLKPQTTTQSPKSTLSTDQRLSEEGEIEKVVDLATRMRMVQQLDKVFLAQGMDVKIILEGDEKDILTLEYILWSRPLVYECTNGYDMTERSFLSNLQKAGFTRVLFIRKVNFDNTYDFVASFDLTK